jgi:hypothetical protein
VLVVVLTIGGCGHGERHDTPITASGSDQRVDERIWVDVERSGGFAGTVIRRSVDTESLPADEARQLADLVADLDVDTVVWGRAPSSPSVRDGFEYDVHIVRGSAQTDLHAQDPNVPVSLRALITFVFQHR